MTKNKSVILSTRRNLVIFITNAVDNCDYRFSLAELLVKMKSHNDIAFEANSRNECFYLSSKLNKTIILDDVRNYFNGYEYPLKMKVNGKNIEQVSDFIWIMSKQIENIEKRIN